MSGGFNDRTELPPLLFGSGAVAPIDLEAGNPRILLDDPRVFEIPDNLTAVGFKKAPDDPAVVFKGPDPQKENLI